MNKYRVPKGTRIEWAGEDGFVYEMITTKTATYDEQDREKWAAEAEKYYYFVLPPNNRNILRIGVHKIDVVIFDEQI